MAKRGSHHALFCWAVSAVKVCTQGLIVTFSNGLLTFGWSFVLTLQPLDGNETNLYFRTAEISHTHTLPRNPIYSAGLMAFTRTVSLAWWIQLATKDNRIIFTEGTACERVFQIGYRKFKAVYMDKDRWRPGWMNAVKLSRDCRRLLNMNKETETDVDPEIVVYRERLRSWFSWKIKDFSQF